MPGYGPGFGLTLGQFAKLYSVFTLLPVIDNTALLQAAINNAIANGQNLYLTGAQNATVSGSITIAGPIDIEGPGIDAMTLTTSVNGYLFNITATGPVKISGLTIAASNALTTTTNGINIIPGGGQQNSNSFIERMKFVNLAISFFPQAAAQWDFSQNWVLLG